MAFVNHVLALCSQFDLKSLPCGFGGVVHETARKVEVDDQQTGRNAKVIPPRGSVSVTTASVLHPRKIQPSFMPASIRRPERMLAGN